MTKEAEGLLLLAAQREEKLQPEEIGATLPIRETETGAGSLFSITRAGCCNLQSEEPIVPPELLWAALGRVTVPHLLHGQT